MVPLQYQQGEKGSSIGYLQTYPQQPPQPQMHPYPMQYPPHHQPMPQYPYPQMAPIQLQYRPYGYMPHVPPIYMRQQAIMTAAEHIVPHDNDVLMGRGGKNNLHKGNEKLREMARCHRGAYIKASKKEKSQLSRELVKRVMDMSPPGRFLKCNRETGAWEAVDVEYAREKASQCLRDAVCHRNPPSSGGASDTGSDSSSESSGSRTSTPVPSTGSDDDQEHNKNVVSPEATRQKPKARDDKEMISLPILDQTQEKEVADSVDGGKRPRKFSKTFWEAVEILGGPACQPKLASSPRCIGGHIACDMRHAERPSAFDCREDTTPNNNPVHDSFTGVSSSQDNMPATVAMDGDDDLPSVSGHSTIFGADLLREEETEEDPFEPMAAWPSAKRPRIGTWETSAFVASDDNPFADGTPEYNDTDLVVEPEDVTNDELSPLPMDCECKDDVEVASDDPFDFEFF